MKFNKKILFFSLLGAILLTGLFWLNPVLADTQSDVTKQLNVTAGEEGAGYGQARDPRAIAALAIQVLLGLIGTVFIAYLVYAGYLIMTSAGEEEKMTRGKKTIFYATLGIIITLSAYSITLFLQRYLITGEEGWRGSAGSGFWYAEGGATIDEDTSGFYNTDPLNQNTHIPSSAIFGD